MRPTKTTSPTVKAPASTPHKAKPASGGHRMPGLGQWTEPSNVLDLQRVIGNQATIQLMQKDNLLQRLPTDEQLKAAAGEPLEDKKLFGKTVKRMSGKYKAVLEALKTYHQRAAFQADSVSILEYQEELLDAVEKACKTYVDAHKGKKDEGERTPQIAKILKEDVPADREKLQFLITNYGMIKRNLAGKTVAEAMNLVEQMKKPTNMAGLLEFLGLETTKEVIRDQTKTQGAQPFRSSDDLTLAGTSFTEVFGKDYLKDVLGPNVGAIIDQLKDKELASKEVLEKPDTKLSPEDLLKKQETKSLLKDLYKQLVVGLLQDTKGGTLVPQEILNAAALTYATVYDTVSQDPKAEHSAEHAARVSVVNMVFLRFINPSVTRIASQMQQGSAQKTLIRLAQIFQSQVNGVDVVKKFAELSDAQDAVQEVQKVVDLIINSVVAQGQILAQGRLSKKK